MPAVLRIGMIDPVTPSPPPCERVLIVDDDRDTLDLLGEVLCAEGVEVVHGATSLAEAEGILSGGFRPTAVILDLLLGVDRGGAFAQRLKADPAFRRVPVIALSGDQLALEEVGAVVERSLLKPARPEEVLLALRQVCNA